jgi:hypothetical protein
MTLHNGCFTEPAVDFALFYVCIVCVSKVTRSVEHLNVKTLRVHLDRVVQVRTAPSVKYSTMKTCGRMEA